jgi:hypothetical protein
MIGVWRLGVAYWMLWKALVAQRLNQFLRNRGEMGQWRALAFLLTSSLGGGMGQLIPKVGVVIQRPSRVDQEGSSPLLRLPPEIWGEITSYFGSDGQTLLAMMSSSRTAHALLCVPAAVTRLHINLIWKRKSVIAEWPTKWFAKFPGLVSIGLQLNPASRVPFSIETISSLPRNLRHLHLGFADGISSEMLSYLPPFLQTLNLEKNYLIRDDGMKNLPESLESLHLPENTCITSRSIPGIPRSVCSLSLRTSDEISEGLASELPALTYLRLCGSNRLPGPSIRALPPTLTKLEWKLKGGIGPFEAPLLPTNLLELETCIPVDVNETLACLPQGLLRLVVIQCGAVSDEGIKALPSSLTSLEFTSHRTIPASVIPHLPPKLQVLVLPKIDQWDPDQLITLPSSLHTLKLPMNAKFTNFWLACLPQTLYSFSCCWNPELTEECTEFLPASVKRLELRSRYEDADVQSFDEAFPTAYTIPRLVRERTASGYLVSTRPWDIYTFEVDQKRLKQISIWPQLELSYYKSPVLSNPVN